MVIGQFLEHATIWLDGPYWSMGFASFNQNWDLLFNATVYSTARASDSPYDCIDAISVVQDSRTPCTSKASFRSVHVSTEGQQQSALCLYSIRRQDPTNRPRLEPSMFNYFSSCDNR
jgi:hypothetical protein